jgi:cbb3-type cytochrome oxidase subunit 1
MSRERHMLPVWFFIGVLLTIYGVITLITAIHELSHPSAVVLAQYHAGIWGGILLIAIGGFYTLRFWPRNPAKKR